MRIYNIQPGLKHVSIDVSASVIPYIIRLFQGVVSQPADSRPVPTGTHGTFRVLRVFSSAFLVGVINFRTVYICVCAGKVLYDYI